MIRGGVGSSRRGSDVVCRRGMAKRSQNQRADREQVKPHFHVSNKQCFGSGTLSNGWFVKMGPAKNKNPTVDYRRAFKIRKTTIIAAPL
jgi:hypothetical protein